MYVECLGSALDVTIFCYLLFSYFSHVTASAMGHISIVILAVFLFIGRGGWV